MKKKETVIGIISIVALVLVVIGITFAYWLVTDKQEGENEITVACLDISLNGENDITLPNQLPMKDKDGLTTTPYTFTVTNNCKTSIDYQINLESIGDEATSITANAIKVVLDENEPHLLSEKINTEPTLDDAYESYTLVRGTLAGASDETTEDEATYDLRLWLDKNAPVSERDKTYRSKITVTIGQLINNSIKEGTLAYDIVSKYGGSGSISSLSTEWREDTPVAVILDTTNDTYDWASDYVLDKETGMYKLSGTIKGTSISSCREKESGCGKYTFVRDDRFNEETQNYIYIVSSFTNSEKADTDNYKYITVEKMGSTNDFKQPTTANDAKLYTAQDDLGVSYYFRGAPSNNYVKFGTYAAGSTVNGITYTEETPMYWRIVRINGDGTIRLVYDGTSLVNNGVAHTTTIGSTVFNSEKYDDKYAGYTYDDGAGKQVDSEIKNILDQWYANNLESSYGKYIADSIFCNDKEVVYEGYELDFDDNLNILVKSFAPFKRIVNKSPKLMCTNKSDRYTVNNKIGNKLLTKPVGLLNVDEIVMAGALEGNDNTSYYLYSNEDIWTMSPRNYSSNDATLFYRINKQRLNYGVAYESMGVRPVISLKADVKFTGEGTYKKPYEIVMD